MSVGFTTLLSVDVALTLLHVCTIQDSLRLSSGNIMCRQLFASTWVDVVLLVLWYIDGISAIIHIYILILVHKMLTSRNLWRREFARRIFRGGTGGAADACGGVRLIIPLVYEDGSISTTSEFWPFKLRGIEVSFQFVARS